jgi:E3 ubiquitin-protein ligase NEDD4
MGTHHLGSHRSPDANLAAGFPDPFAVATINGEQTKTTQVSKRTLNPYWNESFDL